MFLNSPEWVVLPPLGVIYPRLGNTTGRTYSRSLSFSLLVFFCFFCLDQPLTFWGVRVWLDDRYEHVESQSAELAGFGRGEGAPGSAISRFIEDADFVYQVRRAVAAARFSFLTVVT